MKCGRWWHVPFFVLLINLFLGLMIFLWSFALFPRLPLTRSIPHIDYLWDFSLRFIYFAPCCMSVLRVYCIADIAPLFVITLLAAHFPPLGLWAWRVPVLAEHLLFAAALEETFSYPKPWMHTHTPTHTHARAHTPTQTPPATSYAKNTFSHARLLLDNWDKRIKMSLQYLLS